MDDRTGERLNSRDRGTTDLIRGKSQLFFAGMGRLSESSVVSIKNRSFSVTAELDVPETARTVSSSPRAAESGAGPSTPSRDGPIRLQRARHPGVLNRSRGAHPDRHPPGAHGVRLRRGRPGEGRRRRPLLRRCAVGNGRVEATEPMIFSADETTDIGHETGTTVTADNTPTPADHGQDQLGSTRPRRRRPRQLHRPRRTAPNRHGPP